MARVESRRGVAWRGEARRGEARRGCRKHTEYIHEQHGRRVFGGFRTSVDRDNRRAHAAHRALAALAHLGINLCSDRVLQPPRCTPYMYASHIQSWQADAYRHGLPDPQSILRLTSAWPSACPSPRSSCPSPSAEPSHCRLPHSSWCPSHHRRCLPLHVSPPRRPSELLESF